MKLNLFYRIKVREVLGSDGKADSFSAARTLRELRTNLLLTEDEVKAFSFKEETVDNGDGTLTINYQWGDDLNTTADIPITEMGVAEVLKALSRYEVAQQAKDEPVDDVHINLYEAFTAEQDKFATEGTAVEA